MLEVIAGIFLIAGGVFGLIGGIGLLRFPDFYTRLHAAGITDTLCALLIVLGLVISAGFSLLTLKLLLILLFLLFTAPVATHALARSAAQTTEPWRLSEGKKPRRSVVVRRVASEIEPRTTASDEGESP